MLAKSNDEVVYVIAKYDYVPAGPQELSLKKNERLRLMDDSMHWWKVLNSKNQTGFVPSNFVKKEKPSLFDSFRRKVKKLSEAKTKDDNSPLASPTPPRINTVDIDINNEKSDELKKNGLPETPTKKATSQHFAIAKYSYEAQQSDELSLSKGDKIVVLEKSSDGWWKGELSNEKVGWFPSNYVIEETVESFQQKNGSDHTKLLSSNGQETNGNNKITGNENDVLTPPIQFKELVIALYSFKCENEEELSFEKGEQLEVIDKPVCDPDWWLVKNKLGETGLAPFNYLKKIELDEQEKNRYDSLKEKDSKLTNKIWYYGAISRVQCDQLLNEFGKIGDFLVRDSETNAGDYSVSLKAVGRNKHFRVHFEDGVFCIGQRKFTSLDELIEHYKKAPIFTGQSDNEKLYLIKPFLRP